MPIGQTTPSVCIMEHPQSIDPAADTCGIGETNNNGSSWSLVSGFSKDPAENWNPIGGGNGDGSSSSLSKIYLPPAQNTATTSEGIVVQALNVVSDGSSRSVTEDIAPLVKIAKKRRKQNGGVDIEHTKSSKEFIRKAQQSLRELSMRETNGEASVVPRSTQSGPFKAQSMRSFQPHEDRRDVMFSQQTSKSCSLLSRVTVPDDTRQEASSSSSSSSNPYGYEDPDEAVAPVPVRRPGGLAKRRGSVTKFSVQAVAAAQEVTDRLSRLHQSGTNSRASSTTAAVAARRLQGLSSSQSASQLNRRRTPLERSSGMMIKRHSDRSLENGGLSSATSCVGSSGTGGLLRRPRSLVQSLALGETPAAPMQNQSWGKAALCRLNPQATPPTLLDMPPEEPSRSYQSKPAKQESNPYGYGDPGDENPQQPNANPYGYEDMDMAEKKTDDANPYGYGDPDPAPSGHSSLYGYGDPDAQPRPRRQGRAVRRGSVTKFSFQAQSKIVQDQARNYADKIKSIIPMAVDVTTARDTSSMAAPQPVQTGDTAGEEPVIWQPLKPAASSSFGPKKRLGRRTTSRSSKPRPVVRSDSFRSNDDLDTSSSSSEESDSDESSLDESVNSMGLPMAAPRLPTRHDSFLSISTRRSDSGVSMMDSDDDDDGDSLAPDMRSLCSISQRDERTLEPTFSGGLRNLANTPTRTPRSLSKKKSSSFRELREKMRGEGHASFSSRVGGINVISFPVETSPMPSPTKGRTNAFMNSPRYVSRTPSGMKPALSPAVSTAKTVLLTPSSLSPSTSNHKSSLKPGVPPVL